MQPLLESLGIAGNGGRQSRGTGRIVTRELTLVDDVQAITAFKSQTLIAHSRLSSSEEAGHGMETEARTSKSNCFMTSEILCRIRRDWTIGRRDIPKGDRACNWLCLRSASSRA